MGKNLSTRKIAKILGYSASTILNFMKKNDIPRRRCGAPPKVRITKEKLQELYWNQKKSTIEIAKMFGVNRATILYHFKKYQIPLRKRIEAVSEGRHKNIIHNKNDFSNDSLEKQYLIGIAEDFSITRGSKWSIKIALSTSHPSMIKLFRECFSRYGPIWMYPVKDKISNYNWRLISVVNNSFSFLLKSRREYNFKNMNENEFFARLSGIIDAEGSIILTRSNKKYISLRIFIGNENKIMIEEIYKKLKALGYKPRIYKLKEKFTKSKINDLTIKYNNSLWCVVLTKKDDLAKLANKLQLRNKEKQKKLLLLRRSLRKALWSEIEEEIKELRRRIKEDVKTCKLKAKLAFNESL